MPRQELPKSLNFDEVQFIKILEVPDFWILFIYFLRFRAAHVSYGSSQARGRIGTAASGLNHSHSHATSRLRLGPIPQLMAMPDTYQ